eukprot:1160992-Pelagomonas_calceolata.AAC.9
MVPERVHHAEQICMDPSCARGTKKGDREGMEGGKVRQAPVGLARPAIAREPAPAYHSCAFEAPVSLHSSIPSRFDAHMPHVQARVAVQHASATGNVI